MHFRDKMRLKLILLLTNLYQFSLCTHITNSSNRDEQNSWHESEIWGPVLEDFIISSHSRVTHIPIQSVIENDTVAIKMDKNEKESKIASNLKIVNNNANGNRKPSSQITETEMYLLNAIEKLVYKVDFMEKRLRRVEEMLYFVMAGNKVDQEPCPDSFVRAGFNCYLFAGTAGRELDWKAANKQCRKLGAFLVEMENIEEYEDVTNYIRSHEHLRGRDYWTGGLNPGLLWIWSNSAKSVKTFTSSTKKIADHNNAIQGTGRCLRLIYNGGHSYRGTDCASRYSYICELTENSAGNELRRLGRSRKIINEL